MKLERLLVPTDFSDVAECAFMDAIEFAKHSDVEVCHLHVVESRDEVEYARRRLKEISHKIYKDFGVKVCDIIRIGQFKKAIGDVALEMDVQLIIMGTDGMQGMQVITGSHAMKILTKAPRPILIVQQCRLKPGFQNIVVPLDLKDETKQKLDIAVLVAMVFKARIHLLALRESDEFLKTKMDQTVHHVSKYLKEHKIDFTLNYEEESHFSDRLIKFAELVSADLITIMNYKEFIVTEIFGVSREQNLITNNANIPILCVNAKEIAKIVGGY